jgi:hypothetical protein
MDNDINNMISFKTVLMKVVIQGKADVSDWTIRGSYYLDFALNRS